MSSGSMTRSIGSSRPGHAASRSRCRSSSRTAALTVDPAGAGLFTSIPDLLTATHALFATDDVLAAPQRDQLAGAVSTITAADLLLDERFHIRGHGGASPGAQTIVAYDETH